MIVDTIHLKNVTTHDDTRIKLPKRGVVLITGDNGSGKSSIVEGVPAAAWGKTLRGTSPWREDVASTALLDADGLTIVRGRTKDRTKLAWNEAGKDAEKFENTVKAQEALEARIGSFDVWRRANVFSSHDATHFTLAADAERKRLIEAAIGLDVFDQALDACRKDLANATGQHAAARSDVARLGERLQGAKTRLADALKVLEAAPAATDLPSLEAKLAAATGLAHELEADIRRQQAEVDKASSDYVRADSKRAQAQEALQAARGGGVCPACRREFPAGDPTHVAAAEAALRDAAAPLEELKGKAAALRAALRAMEAERDDAVQRRATFQAKVSAATADVRRREEAEAAVARVKASTTEAEAALAQATAAEGKTGHEVILLTLCAEVLGTRGVRAQVLARALQSIEDVANLWLGRIAGSGLRLKLKPFTEKKTGGIADAISLDVEGAGGGFGYRAASGGERRRIDVAIMLALSQVASSSRGREPGTAFFDEVFDALDAEGVNAVAMALHALGEERPVVVISHSPELADRLHPAMRLHVSGGKVERLQ